MGKRGEGHPKVVCLHNTWPRPAGGLPCFPCTGTFLTSTSSPCCGTASCCGALRSLCSWECLFHSGSTLYSEFSGLRGSKVMAALCPVPAFSPVGSCSRYFPATLRLLPAGESERSAAQVLVIPEGTSPRLLWRSGQS